MRQTVSTTTLTCDKCGSVTSSLEQIYVRDKRPSNFQSSMCNHMFLIELCENCYNCFLECLGPEAQKLDQELRAEVERYRSYS